MWRGTTPTHTFTLPKGVKGTDFSVIYISYSQNGAVVLEKTGAALAISQEKISVCLSQTDSLKFKQGPVKIQFRGKLPDGQAVASNIISTTAREILKDGEI